MMRIGYGEDIHRFASDRKLILGGIEIPFEKGLLGHSDADAVTHALVDALLGALALGDIGTLYPDTDPRYEGLDSMLILGHVVGLVKEQGYRVNNVDITIYCEQPKMGPYKRKIAENLAKALSIPETCVSVKAKTNERLDAVGAGEALRVSAIALLEKGETK